jgi:hypothetical protein
MPIAAFESEPQASAAANALRELGFNAEVTTSGGADFDERMRRFFAGNPEPFEAHALLNSDADDERFARTVQRHYGTLIRSDV